MALIIRSVKNTLLVLALLVSAVRVQAQSNDYISNHKMFAAVLSEHYGIPAQVILAVAAVESAYGKGATAKVLNNHFGIVGDNEYVNTKGHKSRYKQYSNEYASYIDFCKMISRKSFYKKLKNNDNCHAWIKAMSRCGYSEQPEEWEKKIMGMLAANRL